MARSSKMKVLVAEKISPEGIEKLESKFDVDAHKKIDREELLDTIEDYDALIVRSGTKVDADVLDKAANLKIIGRAGIGIDNIDVDAATRKGVIVANVPESNIISAAEHTWAVLMALARNVPSACASLSGGEWNRSAFQGVELYGKTLGVIGLGRIGALVAERASAFGMNLVGFDPLISSKRAKQLGVELKPHLDDVLAEADFITLHVPRNKETYHMMGATQFKKMKKGARLVNVSRGGVVDEKALVEAIEGGDIAGAAIDVFETEPPGDNPLCNMQEVVVTPHLGASTTEAQYKAGVAIAEQVISGLKGGFVSGAVNIAMPHKEVVEAQRSYLPLCEKLGGLLSHLMEEAITEVELEILGEITRDDTTLLTVAFLKGFFENISTDPVTYVNAPLLAQERDITVIESKSSQSRDYLNLIQATVSHERGDVTAGATIVGKNQEMFVNVLDYEIEIIPCNNMLFVMYEDRPGMIGKVGSVLGVNKINIESLQVGRKKVGKTAAMGLCLDRPIPEDILTELTKEEGIREAIFIVL